MWFENPYNLVHIGISPGLTKLFSLGLEECETVRAVYSKDLCPNLIAIAPKYFSELIVSSFLDKKLPEVTMVATPGGFELKSYIDEARGPVPFRVSSCFLSSCV